MRKRKVKPIVRPVTGEKPLGQACVDNVVGDTERPMGIQAIANNLDEFKKGIEGIEPGPTDLQFEITKDCVTLTKENMVIKLKPDEAMKLTQQLAQALPLGKKARLAAFLAMTVAKTLG